MPQGAALIFALQDASFRFWGLDDSGNVTLSAKPYFLVYSPDGWQDTGIKNIRNKKLWSVDRSVSIPFKYVEDGAKIIKHVFYTKGPEEPLYLAIMELQLDYEEGVQYGYWYKQVYRAEVDTSSFEHFGALVTLPTIEEGLAKHIKANENTVYEFDLAEANAIQVRNDGIVLKEKHNFLVQQISNTDLLGADDHMPGLLLINKEGFAAGVATFAVYFDKNTPSDFTTDTRYFMITTQAITDMRLFGSLQISVLNTGGTYTLDLVTSEGRTINIVNQVLPVGQTTITINETFDTLDNEKFFAIANFDTGGASHVMAYLETELHIEYESRYAESIIRAFRPQYLFSEFINRMTDGEYAATESDYLGALLHFDKVFTSGEGIRGLTDAKLKMSWNQFLSFWNTFDEVAINEVGKTVEFGRKADFTDYTDPVDLGEIARPKITHDKSWSFNELAIGYPDVKSEEGMLNGKNEFNTTFLFSMGTTKSPRKHEKISQVRASCYDIENLRIKKASKESTDDRSDNDPYVMHIEDELNGDYYDLDRSLNPFLIGVDQKLSVFNVDLSPKRCLLRSGDFLRSCFYKGDGKVLKLKSADRNKEMEYINGSDVILEKADVVIGDLDAPFFVPVLMNVETDAPTDLLDTDNTRCFTMSFDGYTYLGVSMENGINPHTYKKQNYQLLSSPDNDLTKLIDYYG